MVRKWYTTFAVIGYIRGKKWWNGVQELFYLLLARPCPPCGRAFYNGILPFSVPFGDPKGTEKVPATSDSARLAAHNERRHPAKRARSCASKPHRGFDCFATAQQPGLRALGSLRERVGKAAASRALKNLRNVGLAAARRRFLCTGIRSR